MAPSTVRLPLHVLRLSAFPALFCLLAAGVLWPITLFPAGVPFNPYAQYTDLLVSHLPNAQYVLTSLVRYGQLPLWNTQILSGQPLFADPLAGVWYPPLWFAILFPEPVTFNVLIILHLAWAGYGLYGFLRAEGLSLGAALVGGTAMVALPKFIAHTAAGHISLMLAVAWTPWLLRAVRQLAHRGDVRRGALAGACLALIVVADVRWAFYAGLLAGVWWLYCWAGSASRSPFPWRALLVFIVFLFLLSAGLTLPLIEFLSHSGRQALTMSEAAEFSLPPLYLLGLLIPDPYGNHETLTYLGLPTLFLALAGIGRRTRFWALTALAALLFALGTNFVVFPVLFRLVPGLTFLRVPTRAWFIVGLCAAGLVGYGVERLLTALRARSLSPRLQSALPWALMVVVVADVIRISGTLVETRPMPALSPTALWLAAQPGLFRVYSPVYSLPLPDPLQHANGVDPLSLAEYGRFMERASGIPAPAYDVVVPTWVEKDAEIYAASPNAELLGLLNVKYVVVPFPLLSPGFEARRTLNGLTVYENIAFRPRAWVEGGSAEPVIEFWSPNRIEVRATGPGRLVLSEIMYPGWQAWVDGHSTPIELAETILRSVVLPAGKHHVVLEFRPLTVYGGVILSGLGLLGLLMGWRWLA